jgi:1-acyl-sn-glycerol-3-phosphate acyltransferase
MIQTLIGIVRLTAGVALTVAVAVAVLFSVPFDRHGRFYHAHAKFWSRGLLKIFGVRLRIHGLEHLDLTRNYIYVSNHASMFDIPIVAAGVPDDVRLVYKKELEKIPVFGWGLRWGSYIGIDRGRGAEAKKSLDEAVERIRRGASVLLFAEGTRTLDGRLQPFKRGAFNLAVRSGVSVVPMTINGSFSIVPKHSLRIRPGPVDLFLEPPIPIDPEGGRETEVRLMERVRAAIERHYVDQ